MLNQLYHFTSDRCRRHSPLYHSPSAAFPSDSLDSASAEHLLSADIPFSTRFDWADELNRCDQTTQGKWRIRQLYIVDGAKRRRFVPNMSQCFVTLQCRGEMTNDPDDRYDDYLKSLAACFVNRHLPVRFRPEESNKPL